MKARKTDHPKKRKRQQQPSSFKVNKSSKTLESLTSLQFSLYHRAADVLREFIEKKHENLETIIFSLKSITDNQKKACFAIVSETTKCYSLLTDLFDYSKIFEKEKVFKTKPENQYIAYVMAYDLLFGPKKQIMGGGFIKRAVVQYQARFHSGLAKKRAQAGLWYFFFVVLIFSLFRCDFKC